MLVHHHYPNLPKLSNTTVTIGIYDGVHLGHLALLNKIVNRAKANNSESIVITLDPHPRIFFNPTQKVSFLTTIEEKIELLKKVGVDHFVILPFNNQLSQLSANDFLKEILVEKLGISHIIIGHDHKFGNQREGDIYFLKEKSLEFNFTLEEIDAEMINDMTISSTQIRSFLVNGEVQKASSLLGRNYSLTGIVVKGNQRGRTIGYRTANIKIENSEKLIPKIGVYAVMVTVEDALFKGMLNIGFRPTFEGKIISIEVNIFDFDSDIYDQKIKVEFVGYIREEQKFASLEALKNQLAIDNDQCSKSLSSIKI